MSNPTAVQVDLEKSTIETLDTRIKLLGVTPDKPQVLLFDGPGVDNVSAEDLGRLGTMLRDRKLIHENTAIIVVPPDLNFGVMAKATVKKLLDRLTETFQAME